MRSTLTKIIGTAAVVAAMFHADPAHAQGRGNGKGNDKHHDRRHDRGDDRDDGRHAYGRKVPPGLAKKGGLPPGQAKKLYRTDDGVVALLDAFGRIRFKVVRNVPEGDRRYVYYRNGDGAVRRAIVSPGDDRLRFGNLPNDIARQVIARLY
jgi:hypothetical protein